MHAPGGCGTCAAGRASAPAGRQREGAAATPPLASYSRPHTPPAPAPAPPLSSPCSPSQKIQFSPRKTHQLTQCLVSNSLNPNKHTSVPKQQSPRSLDGVHHLRLRHHRLALLLDPAGQKLGLKRNLGQRVQHLHGTARTARTARVLCTLLSNPEEPSMAGPSGRDFIAPAACLHVWRHKCTPALSTLRFFHRPSPANL